MRRSEAGMRVCGEEGGRGYRGQRMKLTLPTPSGTPSKSHPQSPPSPGWHWDPLNPYPLLPQGQGSRCRSLLPFLRVTCLPAPRTPQALLSPAHLGADILIGSWTDEGEADEEDVLGTEQAGVTCEGRPRCVPPVPLPIPGRTEQWRSPGDTAGQGCLPACHQAAASLPSSSQRPGSVLVVHPHIAP